MPLLTRPRTRQPGPQALARINERHWLAKDLAFVHSGFVPFIFGRPTRDFPSVLRSTALAGTANPALNSTRGWVPNGTTQESNYVHSGLLTLPITLSAWWYGVAGTVNNGILTVDKTVGFGAVGLLRLSSGNTNARSWNSSNVSVSASGTQGYLEDRWQHGMGVFASETSRTAYTNGTNGVTSVTLSTLSADWNRFRISALATADIRGIALPMVINRALSAEEVARLYEEQISNPWALFSERPIWVPVAAAPSFRAAWVPRASQVIGAR